MIEILRYCKDCGCGLSCLGTWGLSGFQSRFCCQVSLDFGNEVQLEAPKKPSPSHPQFFPTKLCGVLVFRSVPRMDLLLLPHFHTSTQLCHIQLCHTHTHTFVTYKLSHTTVSPTTLSHTNCHTHTQLCHTQLCHIQIVTHTHNCLGPLCRD